MLQRNSLRLERLQYSNLVFSKHYQTFLGLHTNFFPQNKLWLHRLQYSNSVVSLQSYPLPATVILCTSISSTRQQFFVTSGTVSSTFADFLKFSFHSLFTYVAFCGLCLGTICPPQYIKYSNVTAMSAISALVFCNLKPVNYQRSWCCGTYVLYFIFLHIISSMFW